nr:hypothetical protein [Tanacetum cinerariifolium]
MRQLYQIQLHIKRTRIVEETFHIGFSENTPNNVGSRPNWLFDIDALTKTMNYQPVVAEPKSSQDARFKPSNDVGKKVNKVPRQENECKDQEEKDNVNNTNRLNAVRSTINAASNEVNVVGRTSSIELPNDQNMPELEDISIFEDLNEDVLGAEADLNNLESTFQVSPIPITRIHKDHPLEQVIGDLHSAPQTRRMIEVIRLFLAYASFKDFVVYQMDVKSDFIYGKIEEEVSCALPLKLMHDKFQMSSMGELTFFLGLQVKQKQDRIFISQDKYVAEIPKKYGFSKVKTTSTPMEPQKPLLKDEDEEEVDYVLVPDIKLILRCHTFMHDYAGASLDRKSTTGGCQFLGCRLISWQCKKQTVVANSTTKVEYVAASSCCGQVLWI